MANTHKQLATLFDRSRWASDSGVTGVWAASLRRVPQALVGDRVMRIEGLNTRCTLLPIEAITGPDPVDV